MKTEREANIALAMHAAECARWNAILAPAMPMQARKPARPQAAKARRWNAVPLLCAAWIAGYVVGLVAVVPFVA